MSSTKPTKLSIVYKVSFPNKKVYIGRTCRTLRRRKMQHYGDARRGSNLPFHNALLKYEGIEVWEILHENIKVCEVSELEMLEIKKHNSIITKNGYNLTHGGEGVSMVEVSLETRAKQSKAKLGKKAPDRNDEWKENISKAKLGAKNGMFGKTPFNKNKKHTDYMTDDSRKKFLDSRNKLKKRLVAMNDSGEDVMIFNSLKEATEFFNYKSKSSIGEACVGKYKVAGFFWKYEELKNE